MFDTIISFLKTHENYLHLTQQRMTVVFHVHNNQENLAAFIDNLWPERKLIISPSIDNALPPERAATRLGEEYDLVVFDVREIFNPDALGVISGVLCGGGYLLILLPEENEWNKQNSLFYSHVNKLLHNQSGVYYLKNNYSNTEEVTGEDLTGEDLTTEQKSIISAKDISPYRTCDQKLAVESIANAILLNKNYCGVLTSGRGRGKSSALGFISAYLLAHKNYSILISAPKLSVTDTIFKHLQGVCAEGEMGRSEFKFNNSTVNFIAPDLLLEKLPEADVLFIDEAAAIPLSMLQRLLDHYSKIIFSTTTHGYEGTGRGFILKFFKLLDKVRPGWDKVELHQPIRWSMNDPLEKWIEEVLFLNLKLAVKPGLPEKKSQCQVELLDRKQLLENKTKLAAIFSLLVFAHYRTSPADFKYLLDSENIRIYSLENNNNVLGVLVINQEGGFDSVLSTAVYRGERRPKGNLLAQTLCFHGGCEQAACLKYARVMRIAIHPDVQQSGLGGFLLEQVMKKEQLQGMDVLGSSFSATAPLLNFWNKAGLFLLRLGFSRDHVTSSHSAVMAKALTVDGEKVIENLALKFNLNISLWLKGPLSGLSDDIKNHSLLHQQVDYANSPNQFDLGDVISFARYNRNYDTCMPAITRYLNSVLASSNELEEVLSEQEKKIIHLSMIYMNNWKAIVSEMPLSGKSQALNALRSVLDHLLESRCHSWQ